MKKIIFTIIITIIIAISGKSQSQLKNSIGVRLGMTSWDGGYTDYSSFYELQYIYQISNKIGLVGKFNTGSNNLKLSIAFGISNEEECLNSKFIAKDHKRPR